MCLTRQIHNWEEFLSVAEELDIGQSDDSAYAYRGQSRLDWGLESLFLRELDKIGVDEKTALILEQKAINEFKSQVHLHISPIEYSSASDLISWLTLMQHHEAPTRLLDWSFSIYTAAYFAVTQNFEDDGVIWFSHINSVQMKMKELGIDISVPINDKEHNERFFSTNAPESIQFMFRKTRSTRMITQQGIFSLSRSVLADHGNVLSRILNNNREKLLFGKIVIPVSQKRIFIRKLKFMNVTANSLFPGLDGLGKSIHELIQINLS